ncbi:MAG: DUF4139 domain-containing protein [Elusimicrobiota bacterium]
MKKLLFGLLSFSFIGFLFSADVTIYNDNLGLVRELRKFNFRSGQNEIVVSDVPSHIDPTSVHFKSLVDPDSVSVIEQNFQYDLINQEKILEKYLGQEIELERFTGVNGDRRELMKGILLSKNGGKVLQVGKKIYLNPPGNPILPELPEGLLTKPTLLWQVHAKKAGEQNCELSYLTSGMGWSSDYVLVSNTNDDKMDLNAWVTITNNSGASFNEAKLKLVAGDVNRVQNLERSHQTKRNVMMADAVMESAAPQFSEKSFFEYHLYTLQRPVTLKQNEIKQIEMASAAHVPLKKIFVYDGSQGWYGGYDEYRRSDFNYGTGSDTKVFVVLEFKNSKENNLGLPLPKGRVRVYKKDTDGSVEFIGEDWIDHTAKDERVRIKMGNAFDVVGERKRTNFVTDKKSSTESFEIKLRNHKASDVVVTVVEHLYRWNEWKILDASHKWDKKESQTMEFQIPVKKDGEATLAYTVKYTWP